MEHTKHPVRHRAVYTRKSSEEGLEQDFKSLHAQREACEAFIWSQAGEGWRLPKTQNPPSERTCAFKSRPQHDQLRASRVGLFSHVERAPDWPFVTLRGRSFPWRVL
jgi:hypothetical protein